MFLRSIITSFIVLLLFAICEGENNKTIELTITGIRSVKGEIRVGVCKDNESFQHDKSFKIIKYEKVKLINGVLNVKLDLEYGEYGLSLLDDENSNTKMDYNFIGIPKEGFGFSNYYHTSFTRPNFNDFKFKHSPNQNTKVVMKVRYI